MRTPRATYCIWVVIVLAGQYGNGAVEVAYVARRMCICAG